MKSRQINVEKANIWFGHWAECRKCSKYEGVITRKIPTLVRIKDFCKLGKRLYLAAFREMVIDDA